VEKLCNHKGTDSDTKCIKNCKNKYSCQNYLSILMHASIWLACHMMAMGSNAEW